MIMARITYSTGPIENQSDPIYPGRLYSTVEILILNNSHTYGANVIIKLFKLNGTKQKVAVVRRGVGRRKSKSVVLDVSNLDRFEIQITVKQAGGLRHLKRSVLLTAIGRDADGQFVNRLPLKVTV